MKKFKNFSGAFVYGMKRGFKWYIHQIKYESKWYILPFVLDMVLLPLKLMIAIPLAWFKPELGESTFIKDIYDEIRREDF